MSPRLCTAAVALWAALTAGGLSNFHSPVQQPLDLANTPTPLLNFSSPSPLIFHSVFGLLQQWPNTFFPNGHTIAPCTIAKNTNLYHARSDGSFPPGPEWFAFDPQMSYAIAGLREDSHQLTFRTTKEVQCLYFDGTSASLMDDGSMDTQMLLLLNSSAHVPDHPAWAKPPPRNGSHSQPPCEGPHDSNCTRWNPIQAEYDRAQGLCDLIKQERLGGLGWGFEGIVRMNAAFELIWCNFSSPSARLVSWLNVSAPLLDGVEDSWPALAMLENMQSVRGGPRDLMLQPEKGSSPGMSPSLGHPFFISGIYDWFQAATKRYGFVGGVPGRGESRVRVDSARLFTFYDPALAHQETARVRQEVEMYNLTERGYWHYPAAGADRQAALTKLTRRRRWQRTLNVSESDGQYMRATVLNRMQDHLVASSHSPPDNDWLLAAKEMVTVYGGAIHDLRDHLETCTSDMDPETLRVYVARLRQKLHALWMPYFQYPHFGPDDLDASFSVSAPTSQSAMERCQSQTQSSDRARLSTSENVTYNAISEVLSGVCGSLLPVFLGVERNWLSHLNNISAPAPVLSTPAYAEIQMSIQDSLRIVEELMAWLGWAGQGVACNPGCGLGEVCYIPMWPAMGGFRGGPPPKIRTEPPPSDDGQRVQSGRSGMDAVEDLLWRPKCVSAELWPPKTSE
ncbi:hypothetical protein LTR53_008701 [Teratosphaeriaceae sp. CCFEE 6253]|nr:hypothetical protein LTR53_008701 [Teratosphaeriaceae sp. CCFEE 6253]